MTEWVLSRTLALAGVCCIALGFSTPSARAANPFPAVDVVSRIHTRLQAAVPGHFTVKPPALVNKNRRGGTTPLSYNPSTKRIEMWPEPLQRLVDRLPAKRRTAALALYLGHEYAHHYIAQGAINIGGPLADAKNRGKAAKLCQGETTCSVPPNRQQRCASEWKADVLGGFFAHLAGYDVVGVFPSAIEALYAKGVDRCSLTSTKGYPTPQARKSAGRLAAAAFHRLAVAFETANLLVSVGQYSSAAQLLDSVALAFPSREVFNNAGVAWALAHLERLQRTNRGSEAYVKAHFAFPFELDARSRLLGGRRLSRDVGTTNPAVRARKAFLSAKALDRRYAPARRNLHTLNVLRRPAKDVAAGLAQKLQKARPKSLKAGRLTLLHGIVQAALGHDSEAKNAFQSAAGLGYPQASLNLHVLAQRPKLAAGQRFQAPTPRKTGGTCAKPLGFSAWTATPGDLRQRLTTARLGTHRAAGLSFGRLDGGLTVAMTSPSGGLFEARVIARAAQGSAGCGIGVGTSLAKLQQAYGVPHRTVSARLSRRRHSTLLAYDLVRRGAHQGGLVFEVAGSKVISWFHYHLKGDLR